MRILTVSFPPLLALLSATVRAEELIDAEPVERTNVDKLPAIPECIDFEHLCPQYAGHTRVLPDQSGQLYIIECNKRGIDPCNASIEHFSSGEQCVEHCNKQHAPDGCEGVVLRPDGTCHVMIGDGIEIVPDAGHAFLSPYTSPGSCNSAWPPPSNKNTPICNANTPPSRICEHCNRKTARFGEFGAYGVACGFVYANVTWHQTSSNATVVQCILAAQEYAAAHAQEEPNAFPTFNPEGECVLAIWYPLAGQGGGALVPRKGYAILEPEFADAVALCNVPPSSSRSKTSTRTSASSTRRMSSTTSATCHASAISCPQCNDAEIKDPGGKTYRVFCNNQLYSEKNYPLQHWVTPAGSMAECDRMDKCEGTTFWPEGNCQLAIGEDVFPESRQGFTAFLSVSLSYTAPPPLLSAFPTGAFTSGVPTTKRSSWSSGSSSSWSHSGSVHTTTSHRTSTSVT